MQCGRFALRWRRSVLGAGAVICLAVAFAHAARGESWAAIHGASQYGENHVVTRTLARFEELVRTYYGKPVELALHRDASRGLERQYFALMSQGGGVDYAIVSLVHMADTSKMARLIEAPFLFRDAAHWNAALASGALNSFADEIAAKAGVMIIGFAGGSARNVFAANPVTRAADLEGMKIRVPGAPPWRDAFEAIGTAPRVVPANGIYNEIKKGAVLATEGDVATIEAARLYEVAPNLLPTAHAFAFAPICFSAKSFNALPPELQQAILKAGADAAAYGREIEQAEETARLDTLEGEGKLKRAQIDDRSAMKVRADPVLASYAKEIGAEALLTAINAVK
jgi:TRAP-type transport system periplasmic protein